MSASREMESRPPLPETEVIGPDENGIKITISYKYNELGQMVKVTTTSKVTKIVKKIPRAVYERQQRMSQNKFGACQGLPPGPEPGVTSIGDDVFVQPVRRQVRKSSLFSSPEPSSTEMSDQSSNMMSHVTCRTCGQVGHFSSKCTMKSTVQPEDLSRIMEEVKKGGYVPPHLRPGYKPKEKVEEQKKEELKKTGSYVPPHLRNPQLKERRSHERPTIRITNIIEDATEDDLRDLCEPFGDIARLHMVKDRRTGLFRGSVFVAYYNQADAESAFNGLNGYGYNHLILSVDWAEDRKK